VVAIKTGSGDEIHASKIERSVVTPYVIGK
jgi:hypothetical protein